MITQQRLREVLSYDGETGAFVRLVDSGTSRVGDLAGCKRPDGYHYISVDGVQHLAHRLAFLYVHGELPAHHIDHIDRDRSNNRISNLRPATVSQNILNSKTSKKNTSGHKGVYWSKVRSKWVAQICVDRRAINLGGFDIIDSAVAARKAAEVKYMGEIK